MRNVVVYELLSLDGVAEEPFSFIDDWDDAMQANMLDVIGSQDAVILGRRTYDDWAGFWSTRETAAFGAFINPVAKHVATSRPLAQPWTNARAIDGGLAEFVRALKDQPGGDIGVHGSISVARELLAAGLVDELKLVVAPAVVGAGRRLLDSVPPLRLESTRSASSPTGSQLLDYRVRALDAQR